MRVFDSDQVHELLDYETLIQRLREGFREPVTVPLRHHHHLPYPGNQGSLILMPGWDLKGFGVKLVSVMPDKPLLDSTRERFLELEEKQRQFDEFLYRANSWGSRRVIVKVEVDSSLCGHQPGRSLLPITL